ncbi:hypothetical protein LCGC14_0351670 [marine sediment metagenome]|uniref:Uncharacterized protein n=1 Tax=marine sediment metagenome TaxID=412755 RepID=A0A0F9WIR3_9ZZZZ
MDYIKYFLLFSLSGIAGYVVGRIYYKNKRIRKLKDAMTDCKYPYKD